MISLWIFGENAPRSIELEDQVVTIGRGQSNTIRVKDPAISKRHARLIRNQNGWWIEDLGSVNGTWIESVRVTRLQRLQVGQKFRLGQHEFSLDETKLEEDSRSELEGRGTIFRTLPAIPSEMGDGTVPMAVSEVPSGDALHSSAISGLGAELVEEASKESLEERKLRLIRSVGEAVIDMTELSTVASEILQILVEELQPDRAFLCLFSSVAFLL